MKLVFKGFFMGVADLVPGISGGTVALLTGIYPEFIKTLGSIDLKSLFRLDISSFIKSLNLKFLLPVFAGIFIGIFSLSKIIKHLLENYPMQTWALFFTLVLGSTIVFIMRRGWFNSKSLKWLVPGMLAGLVLTGIGINFPRNLAGLFGAGILGSCAMMLPGISGSFILVMIGLYEYILELLHNLKVLDNFLSLAVFGIGMGIGMLFISKIIKKMLELHEKGVILFFLGIVFGASHVLWPWGNGRAESLIPNLSNSLELIIFLSVITGILLIVFSSKIMKKK